MARKKTKIEAERIEDIECKESSGNIFADFGFPNPEEAEAKSNLAIAIACIIKKNKWTQQEAAEIMGIDQPKVSKIIRGLLSEFTIDRLMRFLNSLNYDVKLTVEEHKTSRTLPCIYVAPNFLSGKIQHQKRI